MLESGRQQCQTLSLLIERIQTTESRWICLVKCPHKEKRKSGRKEVKVWLVGKLSGIVASGRSMSWGVLPAEHHASVVLFHIIEFHLLHWINNSATSNKSQKQAKCSDVWKADIINAFVENNQIIEGLVVPIQWTILSKSLTSNKEGVQNQRDFCFSASDGIEFGSADKQSELKWKHTGEKPCKSDSIIPELNAFRFQC